MAKRRGRISVSNVLPFWRWGSRHRPISRANRKLRFETLEPRVLLDADPIPLDGLLDLSGEQSDLAIIISVAATGEITVSGSSASDGTYTGVSSITGSAGDDLLVGPAQSATWSVTGDDAGRLSFGDIQLDFSGVENLQGASSADDTFVVAPEGSLAGGLDGGVGGNDVLITPPGHSIDSAGIEVELLSESSAAAAPIDVGASGTLDLSAEIGDLTLSVTSPGEITVTGSAASDGTYTGVSSILSGGGNDLLVGPGENATWVVSGGDSGQLVYGSGGIVMDFSGIESLAGSDAANDAFTMAAGGSLSGGIEGGAGGTDTLVIQGDQTVITGGIESTLIEPAGGILDLSAENGNVSISITAAGALTITGTQSRDGDYRGVTSIVGGAGNDLVIGSAGDVTWNITGNNSGTIIYAGTQLEFAGIENLQGAAHNVDTFVVSADGNLSGSVDGGAFGTDELIIDGSQEVASEGVEVDKFNLALTGGVLDLSGEAAAASIVITVTGAGTATVSGSANADGSYRGVMSILGSGGNATLTGPDEDATWNVDGADAGSLAFAYGAVSMEFSGIANLTGGGEDDTFVVWAAGSLSGGIDGGAGSDGLDLEVGAAAVASSGVEQLPPDPLVNGVLDLSAESGDLTITITGGGAVSVSGSAASDGDYTGVTEVIGGSGANTLVGAAGTAKWNIDGPDSGQVVTGGAAIGFASIGSLSGAAGSDDKFVLADGGGMSGGIDGGAGGSDELVDETGQPLAMSGIESSLRVLTGGLLDLSGEAEGQSIVIAVMGAGAVVVSGSTSNDGEYSGITSLVGSAGDDTLVGPSQDATWHVHLADEGELTFADGAAALGFAGIEFLEGGSGADDFIIRSAGHVSGGIEGGAGADTLDSEGAQLVSTSSVESVVDLFGLNEDATWTVTSDGSGTFEVDSSLVAFEFAGFEHLAGTAESEDTFVIVDGGSIDSIDGGAGGFDSLVFEGGSYDNVTFTATGPSSGTVDLDGSVVSYTGLEPITINTASNITIATSAGADVMTLEAAGGTMMRVVSNPSTFEAVTFDAAVATSLTIDGGEGTDSLTVADSFALSGDISITAEMIIVSAGVVITEAANVSLTAVADSSTSGAGPSATAAVSAQVQVDGTISASGDVVLRAVANNAVALTEVATSLAIGSGGTPVSTTATAEVGATAQITAATLAVTAYTNTDLSATVTGALIQTADIDAVIQTSAGIAGGATINVGTGAIAGETASVLVEAIDTSDVQTSITTGLIASLTGFDMVTSSIDLGRDTHAYIGDGTTSTAVHGSAGVGTATGVVEIRAANLDGVDGGVHGEVSSELIGVHTTTVSQDDVVASVSNAVITTTALEIDASNEATYAADAKVASNSVVGRTMATIDSSTITATPATTDAGVVLGATDSSTISARSGDFQANLEVLSALGIPSVELGKAAAINQIDKDTEASISDSASTVIVTDGLVSIEATSDQAVSAEAEALAVIEGSTILNTYNLALGGTFASNEMLGGVDAYIADSTVTASGVDGHVLVNATNTAVVDSTAEASTKVTGGTNAAVGVSVAFNAIGWDIANFLAETLETLTGAGLGATDNMLTSRASITDSTVTAGGGISVTATLEEALNATVSNTARSTASALFGASGMAIGGIVAGNRVSSAATAYIEDTNGADGLPTAVVAGDDVTVSATDSAAIHANAKVVSSSITTNDGGAAVLAETVEDLIPANYETAGGVQDLEFGDRVRLAGGYLGGGNAGAVYEFMGTAAAGLGSDLGTTDYSDLGLWKQVLETQLIPQGNNLTASDSVAVGGVVVLNVLSSEAEAYIEAATVEGAAVTVQAIENATLHSTADVFMESSGGSAFGTGTSSAVGGVLAINTAIAGAKAYIENSVVDALTADVWVDAQHTSQFNALTQAAMSSGGDAVGIAVAFNMLGWNSDSLLSMGIDALIGEGNREDVLGLHTARAVAYVSDADITAAGNVLVTATNAASMEAHTGTDATAIAKAFVGAKATSATGAVALNLVSSEAQAYIEDSGLVPGRHVVDAGGAVTVRAKDEGSIDAETSMGSVTKKVNDLGSGIFNDLINELKGEYQYTNESGLAAVEHGVKVRVEEGYFASTATYDTSDGEQTVALGETVSLASDYENGGIAGATYAYLGAGGTLDLEAADYADVAVWQQVDGVLYAYMGEAAVVDLSTADYQDFELWKLLTSENLIPKSVVGAAFKAFKLAGGSASSKYGILAFNEVSSDAGAAIRGMDVVADGTVTVEALEKATITTSDQSVVSISGGAATGGVIALNMVNSDAVASIVDSEVTTEVGGGGNVLVNAENAATLDATTTTSAKSSEALNLAVALNTVGYDSSGILFSLAESLLGTDAFVLEPPSSAQAYVVGSTLDVDGAVSVTASSASQLNATAGADQVSIGVNEMVVDAKGK